MAIKRKTVDPQIRRLQQDPTAYGGRLLCYRRGRARGRPVYPGQSMHMVLRSSKAVGPWSFKRPHNERKVDDILKRFAQKHGVRVHSVANVGNHLHLHLTFSSRKSYMRFIRGVTAAIAMAITGASRWRPLKKKTKDSFWDRRPFTRIIRTAKALLRLKDYLSVNRLEGWGYNRIEARFIVAGWHDRKLRRLPPHER